MIMPILRFHIRKQNKECNYRRGLEISAKGTTSRENSITTAHPTNAKKQRRYPKKKSKPTRHERKRSCAQVRREIVNKAGTLNREVISKEIIEESKGALTTPSKGVKEKGNTRKCSPGRDPGLGN